MDFLLYNISYILLAAAILY